MTPVSIAQLRTTATVDLMTAAAALGLGRTKAYELARRDQFPCRVIRIGDTYRIPTPGLLELLGVTAEAPRHGPASLTRQPLACTTDSQERRTRCASANHQPPPGEPGADRPAWLVPEDWHAGRPGGLGRARRRGHHNAGDLAAARLGHGRGAACDASAIPGQRWPPGGR